MIFRTLLLMNWCFIFTIYLCFCLYLYFILFLNRIYISDIRLVFSLSIFMCMSPMILGYKELGLELFEPLQDHPCQQWWPPMVEENKYQGVRYPIKILLKEALEWQMNEMMDKFAKILQKMPTGDTSSSNNHFKGINNFVNTIWKSFKPLEG